MMYFLYKTKYNKNTRKTKEQGENHDYRILVFWGWLHRKLYSWYFGFKIKTETSAVHNLRSGPTWKAKMLLVTAAKVFDR